MGVVTQCAQGMQNVYHGDKLMASLWLVDPATIKRPTSAKRKIGSKPLIDLDGLQAAIRDGALEEGDVWLATGGCNKDMQNLEWTIEDLLACMQCLCPVDHRGAEWCEISAGRWFACDVYVIRYDEKSRRRSPQSLEFYLKFSIDEAGSLTLVMVRVHLSR